MSTLLFGKIRLNTMHYIEDIFVLTADHYANLIADFRKFFRESRGIFIRFTGICNHHHVKIPLYDSLGNIQNVYVVVCKIGTYLCNDSYGVISYYCNDCFFL